MLIGFSVGNYRSFQDIVTFSMVASDAANGHEKVDKNNVFTVKSDLKLLKSAAI
jgi:AAA15 family ATPase/GTPase